MTGHVPDGLILGDRWRIDHVIAVGGMSTVHAATDLHAQRTVAVKVLLDQAKGVSELVARFRREQHILALMTSVHVPRLLGEGQLDDGTPYLVMEHLTGSTLADLFGSWGALPLGTAASYIIQTCEAIAEAHSLGVVHRDLKPANLFITSGESGFAQVKVLDFGISKSPLSVSQGPDPREQSLTRATDVFGSPQYMSPEQLLASRHVDHAADIWSIGILLHEMVTGSLPFEGDTVESVRAAVMTTPPRAASELCPDIPTGLQAVILRCLEKYTNDRYDTVEALARALLPFAEPREPAEADLERIAAYGPPARIPMPSDPAAAMDALDVWNPDRPAAHGSPPVPRAPRAPSLPGQKLAILWGPFPEPEVPEPYVPVSVRRERARRHDAKVLIAVGAAGMAAGTVIGVLVMLLLRG